MGAPRVLGDIRVQQVRRGDGRRSFLIVLPDSKVYEEPDGFLRECEGGTDRTYAYLLVDHLRWLESEGLPLRLVKLADLQLALREYKLALCRTIS
jgi:hypothetical protein